MIKKKPGIVRLSDSDYYLLVIKVVEDFIMNRTDIGNSIQKLIIETNARQYVIKEIEKSLNE